MTKNVFDVLKERDFVKQVVFEEELYKKLGEESVTFYIGFDPTADSLHVGHFVQLMAMAHTLDSEEMFPALSTARKVYQPVAEESAVPEE